MKKTGGDFFTLAEIRAMLRESNDAYDGGGEVALVQREGKTPQLECQDSSKDAVVYLPGDGRPFPERAFAEALRVAPVIVERE